MPVRRRSQPPVWPRAHAWRHQAAWLPAARTQRVHARPRPPARGTHAHAAPALHALHAYPCSQHSSTPRTLMRPRAQQAANEYAGWCPGGGAPVDVVPPHTQPVAFWAAHIAQRKPVRARACAARSTPGARTRPPACARKRDAMPRPPCGVRVRRRSLTGTQQTRAGKRRARGPTRTSRAARWVVVGGMAGGRAMHALRSARALRSGARLRGPQRARRAGGPTAAARAPQGGARVRVEQRGSAAEGFGRGATVRMAFAEFLQRMGAGDATLYLTTQRVRCALRPGPLRAAAPAPRVARSSGRAFRRLRATCYATLARTHAYSA